MMKSSVSRYAAGALALGLSLAYAAAPVIDDARVNSAVDAYAAQMKAQGAPAQAPADASKIREQIRLSLQKTDILKEQALAAGLDKDPKVQAFWQNLQSNFYAQQYIDHLKASVAVSETDLRQTYARTSQQIRLQAALFKTAEDAEKAKSLLLKGMSFEELIKTLPNQPKLNDDYLSVQQLPPEFQQVVAQMTTGQTTSTPVAFNNGYWLLKLADTRADPKAPPFDQVKDQLADQAKDAKIQAQLQQIFKDHGVQ